MKWNFPAERETKRRALLDAVDRIRDIITACADEAEATATLRHASVQALYESGLLAMKLPKALGGAEADPATQVEVIEAVSRLDGSAGWSPMTGATTLAVLAAFAKDAAIERIFAADQTPTAVGVLMPAGMAVPVDRGYEVSGRWPFASEIRHAEWVSAAARVLGEDGSRPDILLSTLNNREMMEEVTRDLWKRIVSNRWAGTGSNSDDCTQQYKKFYVVGPPFQPCRRVPIGRCVLEASK